MYKLCRKQAVCAGLGWGRVAPAHHSEGLSLGQGALVHGRLVRLHHVDAVPRQPVDERPEGGVVAQALAREQRPERLQVGRRGGEQRDQFRLDAVVLQREMDIQYTACKNISWSG